MNNDNYVKVGHEFPPVYDENSKILILGSIPSVKSRESGFYYGNKNNRFWPLLSELFKQKKPETNEEKRAFLLRNRIALWDVAAVCDIVASSDSSIRNVRANDIGGILSASPVERVFANGAKAYELYMKLCYEKTGREIIKLPSTSPANAAYGMDRLLREWEKIL